MRQLVSAVLRVGMRCGCDGRGLPTSLGKGNGQGNCLVAMDKPKQ